MGSVTRELDIPEGWETEDVVNNWHELTGDEYMRVVGPLEVM